MEKVIVQLNVDRANRILACACDRGARWIERMTGHREGHRWGALSAQQITMLWNECEESCDLAWFIPFGDDLGNLTPDQIRAVVDLRIVD